jgi:crossover junction endodeoxyribonuclease RusA
VEIEFPIEFIVAGTPVSSQAKLPKAKAEWKERVKAASSTVLPTPHFASDHRMAVTLFYFPNEVMQGDVDNIVKLVLDALGQHIYINDSQVDRIVVQKFEPGNIFGFGSPSAMLAEASEGQKPVLYVRLSDDPFEDLR